MILIIVEGSSPLHAITRKGNVIIVPSSAHSGSLDTHVNERNTIKSCNKDYI